MGFFKQQPLITIVISILVLFNLVLISLILAPELKPDFEKGQDRRGGFSELVAKELNFTVEQQEQFQQLHVDHRKQMRQLQSSINQKRAQMFELLKEDGDHSEAIERITKEMGELVTDLEFSNFLFFSSIRSLCTEDQLQGFDELMGKIRNRKRGGGPDQGGPRDRGAGRGEGPGGPPPPGN